MPKIRRSNFEQSQFDRVRFRRDKHYTLGEFKECDLIQGETLDRFWYRPDLADRDAEKNEYFFVVRRATDLQRRQQCDGCIRRHEATRLSCTAHYDGEQESPYVDMSKLYEFGAYDASRYYVFDDMEQVFDSLAFPSVYGVWVTIRHYKVPTNR